MKYQIEELVKKAFQEDLPQQDITTSQLDIDEVHGRAQLLAKADLVLSGTDIFASAMQYLDPEVEVRWHFQSGEKILKGQKVATLVGNLTKVIQAERVALNFLGHLTGVATLTNIYVENVKHTSCRILDTRKTLPTFRLLEKRAVMHGGGVNHRMNLSDSVLIKENHIALNGGDLAKTINKFIDKGMSPIHVEVKNLKEAQIALEFPVQRLLLDNMSNEEMAQVIKIKPKELQIEASGNMNLERVASVAELGVDFISVGAITHSAPCADLSLIFDWKED